MRRLVGVSSKTKKFLMAVMALAISLTSIHMAASARSASLRHEQEQLEQTSVGSSQEATRSEQRRIPGTLQPAKIKGDLASVYLTATPSSPGNNPGAANAAAGVSTAVSARKRQIVISIADRKLAVMEEGRLLKTYAIAVGTRSTPSPDGDFVIINRAKDPTYRHGDKEIPPGKDNPLGSRWMGLSLKGYGIHGTNVQSSVGKAASHGCFRMRKQDVEELYTLVQVGDTVIARRERDAMIAEVFSAPPAPAIMTAAKAANAGEAQLASATVTTVETTQQ